MVKSATRTVTNPKAFLVLIFIAFHAVRLRLPFFETKKGKLDSNNGMVVRAQIFMAKNDFVLFKVRTY
jgi:hypothetical protein